MAYLFTDPHTTAQVWFQPAVASVKTRKPITDRAARAIRRAGPPAIPKSPPCRSVMSLKDLAQTDIAAA
ncbi:MAG TPA: hypothetical protein VMW23_02710 [Sedimentisphaerales bacterium]|nr:hypothetical protein [Sedimentisphaerales bacterium]